MDVNNNDILSYAISQGIIDLSYVKEQIAMNKRKQILKKYGSCIWFSETEKTYYCHLPDITKKEGRKKYKRKSKEKIEDIVVKYWLPIEFSDDNNVSSDKIQNQTTFEELFYEFMEYKKNQIGSGTVKRMMNEWNRFYIPHPKFIKKAFCEITKIDIDMFLNEILQEQNLKDKAFRNMCGLIKQTFEYAVDAEYIEKSPYRVKVNKKNIIITRKNAIDNSKEVFRPDERDMLNREMEMKLKKEPSNLIPLIIMLDFEIGTRIGEILAIGKGDIKDNKVHIHRQQIAVKDVTDIHNIVCKGWTIVEYTKSDSGDRWIPLSNKALEYIQRIDDIMSQYYNRVGDYLFLSEERTINEHAVNKQLIRGCEHIGITPRSTHKIRKTYASTLYRNGIPVSIISKLLGHVDESTTLKHYIFNIENSDETDKMVLDVLNNEGTKEEIPEKVTKSDQKIIRFPSGTNPKNPLKNQYLLS